MERAKSALIGYLRYLGGRFVMLVASVVLSISIVFIVPRLVPGNPLGAVFLNLASVGGSAGAAELIAEYEQRFGLDKGLWEQFVRFVGELLRGNLGYSIANFPSRVSDLLIRAVPWTIGLLGTTTVVSWLIGTLIGALAGWQGRRSRLSQALVGIALVLYTVPYYILAIILVFLFAYYWRLLPLSGGYTPWLQPELSLAFAADVLRHAVLPSLSIVLVSLGWWFLSMRSLILSVKGEDYILQAESKGLPQRRILWAYGFRNALLPQVTGLTLSLSHVVGGALITEVIFAYPGVGWLLYNAIKGLDFPVIQGGVLLIILSVAVANFAIDLAYPLIDPRIRHGAQGGD